MKQDPAERKQKIEIGYRFGHLTVEERTGQKKNGFPIWRCRCDCGGEILLDTRAIRRGAHKDCGCITKLPIGAKDITGQRFGRLVALEPTGERNKNDGSIMWRCICDCGKETEAPLKQLAAGYKKSCGCWGHPPVRELAGKRFGSLTVIRYVEKREGQHIWLCRCDCGNETEVRQNYLQRGHTTSCGCLQKTRYAENLRLIDDTSLTILDSRINRDRLLPTNTSGHTGVYRHRKSGTWRAQITFQGKTYSLGGYDNIDDAVKARKEAEEAVFHTALPFYEAWQEKAAQDPQWAKENPVSIRVVRNRNNRLYLEMQPDLSKG